MALDPAPGVSPFALDRADHPRWHGEPGYEPVVASILVRAYARLRLGGSKLEGFFAARRAVERLAGRPMSARQFIRACYVLCAADAAVGNLSSALEWAERALEHAWRLPPSEEAKDLLHLKGVVLRGMMRRRHAATAFRECLALLRERRAEGRAHEPADSTLELEALGLLANAEFMLAHYAEADRLIREARVVAPRVPDTPQNQVLVATLHWFEAYLWRWRGEPARALVPAARAADIYTRSGQDTSAARIQALTAHIALDLAEELPEGSDRCALLDLALPHIDQAMRLTRQPHDEGGRALAWIVRARHSRLGGLDDNRFEWLDGVLDAAERGEDVPLRAQGLTALADELVAGGDAEAALAHYRAVVGMMRDGESPALALPARQAIERLGR